MSGDGNPDWWRTDKGPADADSGGSADMAAAAENIRDAAEYLRDMSVPEPPPKERNWDLSWLTNWLKHKPFGKALKVALITAGPAGGLLLWIYSQDQGDSSGAGLSAFGLMLSLIAHWKFRNALTRTLIWGAILAPVFYLPALVSAVFGVTQILVGGVRP